MLPIHSSPHHYHPLDLLVVAVVDLALVPRRQFHQELASIGQLFAVGAAEVECLPLSYPGFLVEESLVPRLLKLQWSSWEVAQSLHGRRLFGVV